MAVEQASVTILVDNNANEGLVPEHGLSLWIKADNFYILLDSGQGTALPANAAKLQIPLEKADAFVLSHGHYDHSGGISHVLSVNPKIAVYCHPEAFVSRCSVSKGLSRSIGMPKKTRKALDGLPLGNMRQVLLPVIISPDIGLTGPIPRNETFEDVGGPFFLDSQGCFPDSIADDQALWMNTSQGLVVCVGCCHAGLINTLNYVRRLSGISEMRAVIGGFHLINADEKKMAKTIKALRSMDVKMLVPCHCTGETAVRQLGSVFADRVCAANAGMTFHYISGIKPFTSP